MFTLTLPRSARVKIGQSLCGFAALVSIQNAALSADANLRVADADEVREVHSRIASIFANLDDFPEAPVSVAKLEKKLYWSGVGAHAILLAPVVVHFRGLTNSYCRLVTLKAESKQLTLVQLPAQANFDDCSGIDQIRYVDVNDDGLLDVIETVKVKSNVHDAQVSSALVYLSSSKSPGGYCYATAASRQLAPIDLKNDASVMKALRRSGQSLQCDIQL